MCFGRSKSFSLAKDRDSAHTGYKRLADPLTASTKFINGPPEPKRARVSQTRGFSYLVDVLGFQPLSQLGLGGSDNETIDTREDGRRASQTSRMGKENISLRRRHTRFPSVQDSDHSAALSSQSTGLREVALNGSDNLMEIDNEVMPELSASQLFWNEHEYQLNSVKYSDPKERKKYRMVHDPDYVPSSDTESESGDEALLFEEALKRDIEERQVTAHRDLATGDKSKKTVRFAGVEYRDSESENRAKLVDSSVEEGIMAQDKGKGKAICISNDDDKSSTLGEDSQDGDIDSPENWRSQIAQMDALMPSGINGSGPSRSQREFDVEDADTEYEFNIDAFQEVKDVDEATPLKLLDGFAVMNKEHYLRWLNDCLREYYNECFGKSYPYDQLIRSQIISNSPPYLFQLSEFVDPQNKEEIITDRMRFDLDPEALTSMISKNATSTIFFSPVVMSSPTSPVRVIKTVKWKEFREDFSSVPKRVDLFFLNLVRFPTLQVFDGFWRRFDDIVDSYPPPTLRNPLPILTAHMNGKADLYNHIRTSREHADHRTLKFIDKKREEAVNKYGRFDRLQEEQSQIGERGMIAFSHLPECIARKDILGIQNIIERARTVCNALDALCIAEYDVRELAVLSFPFVKCG